MPNYVSTIQTKFLPIRVSKACFLKFKGLRERRDVANAKALCKMVSHGLLIESSSKIFSKCPRHCERDSKEAAVSSSFLLLHLEFTSTALRPQLFCQCCDISVHTSSRIHTVCIQHHAMPTGPNSQNVCAPVVFTHMQDLRPGARLKFVAIFECACHIKSANTTNIRHFQTILTQNCVLQAAQLRVCRPKQALRCIHLVVGELFSLQHEGDVCGKASYDDDLIPCTQVTPFPRA